MRLITPLGACAQGQCRNVCKPHDALDSFLGTLSFIQDDAQPVAALAIHILTPVWNPSFAVSAYPLIAAPTFPSICSGRQHPDGWSAAAMAATKSRQATICADAILSK